MKKILTFLLCLLLLPALSPAQSIGPSTLNAAGKSVTISGNTYEYAIGGLIGGSYVSSGLVVTPYALQPVPPSTGIPTPGINASDLSVFPNPSNNVLYLQPKFGKKGTLEYVMTDVLGRTIASRKVSLEKGNERQEIDMTSYATGQYHLNVYWLQQGTSYHSTYKVQKIN